MEKPARRKEPFLVATLVMLAARETWSKNPTGIGEEWRARWMRLSKKYLVLRRLIGLHPSFVYSISVYPYIFGDLYISSFCSLRLKLFWITSLQLTVHGALSGNDAYRWLTFGDL